METTTPDEGVVQTTQPDESVAVTTGYNADQVITTDDSGTPTMVPVTSDTDESVTDSNSAEDAVSEKETQATDKTDNEFAADKTDEEMLAWSEKKGIKINPENPNEVRLARMQLDAERKMHAATQPIVSVEPAEELPLTGDVNYDAIAERLNRTEQLNYVRNWFDANPSAKDSRAELQQIAEQRPWLTNMDDVYAHYLANPSREADIKREGGKEALTNLAQKQSQVPPASGATNSTIYESQQITPSNVYDLVDKNDQAWFEKNHDAISKAMQN